MANVYALILAGGSGTRFWPASRRAMPKQLLPIAPGDAASLLSRTVTRIQPVCPPERVRVATGAHLIEATRREVPWLPAGALLGEPAPRNTAACIAWGTALIAREDPEAVVMALPSDQHIGDEAAFLAAVAQAVASAATGPITTLGIRPTRPETGYGYIEAGEELGGGARRVRRFVEKPDRARAEEYLRSGRHFWNSGMFFFRASAMLDAVRRHMPELARGLERIEEAVRRGTGSEADEIRAIFEELPSISVDYGVMEKESPLNVIPASFGWSDLGSWETAYELAEKDAEGNAADEEVVLVDARRNLVRDLSRDRRDRVIALVGVSDLCVVETDDALLVIPRDRSQDVREVVEELKARGRGDRT